MPMCFIKRSRRPDCAWLFVALWNNFHLLYLGIGCERTSGKLLKDDGKFGDTVGTTALHNALPIFLWRRIHLCNHSLESCSCFPPSSTSLPRPVPPILWIWVTYLH
uniref:Uncharacterized protein n=1 Tax=Physcomitrium patens TaxID=3218 RepID=A0A2K1K2E3_PHYPA|nr:hypothetical protein PHYPA_012419 [Physcomitrium patens]